MEQKYLALLEKLQKGSDFLDDFTHKELGRFLRLVQPEPYKAGARIFEKGDPTDHCYLILTGKVEIYALDLVGDHMYKTFAELGTGEVFGEMGLVMRRTRTASARAKDNVVLFKISDKLFDSDQEMRAKIWKNMCAILAKRLEEANRKYA